MPNRIIKESICTSDTIDSLSMFEEVVFYRLIVNCDDFGRFDARPKVLSSKLFPLKDISVEQMQGALDALCAAGLIIVYVVNGRPYLQMNTWHKHQSQRATKSKYPSPDESDSPASENNSQELASNCMQMISSEEQPQADESNCKQMSPYSYSYSYSRSGSESARAREDATAAAENAFADDDDARPNFDTVEVYATNELKTMTAGNMQELASFKRDLPEALIKHAIDEAGAAGARTWSYVRRILNRYVEDGIKTVGDAKAQEESRGARGARSSPKVSAAEESDAFWGKVKWS